MTRTCIMTIGAYTPKPRCVETTWTNTEGTRLAYLTGDIARQTNCGILRLSPNHGTLTLPNDDDDDRPYISDHKHIIPCIRRKF